MLNGLRVGTEELGDFVLVVGEVVADAPIPVLGADGLPVNRHLNTLVLHRTDVRPNTVVEVGTCGSITFVEQVGGLAVVQVDATRDALVEESPVETDVGRRGGLPLQVRVISLRCI